MPALNDATCPKCCHRFGWTGSLTDRPPCPRCKHTIPKSSLLEAQKIIDDAVVEMSTKYKQEWDARTPEQDEAFHLGKKAFSPSIGRIKVHKLNPYFRPISHEAHPLSKWWIRGWNHSENEYYESQQDTTSASV